MPRNPTPGEHPRTRLSPARRSPQRTPPPIAAPHLCSHLYPYLSPTLPKPRLPSDTSSGIRVPAKKHTPARKGTKDKPDIPANRNQRHSRHSRHQRPPRTLDPHSHHSRHAPLHSNPSAPTLSPQPYHPNPTVPPRPTPTLPPQPHRHLAHGRRDDPPRFPEGHRQRHQRGQD